MKTKVGCLGSCISRDAFNSDFVHNYKDYFKMEISAQRTLMISFLNDPLIINEELIKIEPNTKRNRAKSHCISYDLNKSFLKEMIEKNIDILVIDNLLEVVLGILYFDDHIITNNRWHFPLTKFNDTITDEFILNITEFPEEYFCIWSKYCDLFFKFLEIYCPNVKVVLVQGRLVDKILKPDNTIKVDTVFTTKANVINPLLDKLDSYIIDNFDVEVIEFDFEKTFLDENHIWGYSPVHYHKDYHYNLIEEVRTIAKNHLNDNKAIPADDSEKEKFRKQVKKANFETKLFLKYMKKSNMPDALSIYNRARIDMKNFGNKDNRIEVVETILPPQRITFPKWLKNEEGEGIMVRSENGTLDMKIKCINDGLLKISIRGPDMRDKNKKRFPIYIDYTNFSINSEPILKNNVLVCHDTPYLFKKEVKDSEIIDIHLEWLPFNESSVYNG